MTNEILQEGMKITFDVEVFIVKENKYFVAYCPSLKLSSYADSEEGAKAAFNKELKIFLDETKRKGTLEKYLLMNGWRLQQHPHAIYEPPRHKLRELRKICKSNVIADLKVPVSVL